VNTRKTILFILQRAPYGCSSVRESLEAALAAAAFEQHIQLLFSGDGVFALLANQQPDAIQCKDTGKMLHALHYYDIEDVFVDAVSLEERALDTGMLAIQAKPAHDDSLRELLRHADCVVAL